MDFRAPHEVWNPLSKAEPGKFHGSVSGRHLKRNCLQDRAKFHRSRAWKIVLFFSIVMVFSITQCNRFIGDQIGVCMCASIKIRSSKAMWTPAFSGIMIFGVLYLEFVDIRGVILFLLSLDCVARQTQRRYGYFSSLTEFWSRCLDIT